MTSKYSSHADTRKPLLSFYKLLLEDISLFCGATDTNYYWRASVFSVEPLIPMFWTFGDVCPRFQSQDWFLACLFHHLHAMDSSHSPLVPHRLISWWHSNASWQLSIFILILAHTYTRFDGTRTQDWVYGTVEFFFEMNKNGNNVNVLLRENKKFQ